MPAALRNPANHFLFASEWADLAKDFNVPHAGMDDDDIAVAVINAVHANKPGARLMVMFDAGDPAQPGIFPQKAVDHARAIGAELAIYVEGPGGPTGNEWSEDEKERVRRAGEKVGIQPGLKFDEFLKRWHDGKWQEYTFQQLSGFLAKGYSAAEIDNLDQVLGEDNQGKRLIPFLQTYAKEHKAGRLPRLLLKNISETRLARLVTAVTTGEVPRAALSEFHIAETGSGSENAQAKESEKIAIRTLFSHDTNHYRAQGAYGLEAKFAEIDAGAAVA